MIQGRQGQDTALSVSYRVSRCGGQVVTSSLIILRIDRFAALSIRVTIENVLSVGWSPRGMCCRERGDDGKSVVERGVAITNVFWREVTMENVFSRQR